ncbi:MAG: glycosyltransferase family 2 protein [Myxococcota bacterium]
MSDPLVSAVMVTRDRVALARRAFQCLRNQSWPNVELVIVDDGDESYEDLVAEFQDDFPILYHRIEPDPEVKLGGLRNLSQDLAKGEYLVQWDDDEWFHPDRIRYQMSVLREKNLDAVVLRSTLMHLDSPRLVDHPYRSALPHGIPGTILHRRTEARYPNWRRHEDAVFRRRVKRKGKLGIATGEHAHLFIRCFHGTNTWEEEHFTERLHYRWPDKFRYLKARFIDGDVLKHPAFNLTAEERASTEQMIQESRELGVLQNGG